MCDAADSGPPAFTVPHYGNFIVRVARDVTEKCAAIAICAAAAEIRPTRYIDVERARARARKGACRTRTPRENNTPTKHTRHTHSNCNTQCIKIKYPLTPDTECSRTRARALNGFSLATTCLRLLPRLHRVSEFSPCRGVRVADTADDDDDDDAAAAGERQRTISAHTRALAHTLAHAIRPRSAF